MAKFVDELSAERRRNRKANADERKAEQAAKAAEQAAKAAIKSKSAEIAHDVASLKKTVSHKVVNVDAVKHRAHMVCVAADLIERKARMYSAARKASFKAKKAAMDREISAHRAAAHKASKKRSCPRGMRKQVKSGSCKVPCHRPSRRRSNGKCSTVRNPFAQYPQISKRQSYQSYLLNNL